ncbi:hypothetical protein, partial [Flavobacterium sp.]|uniref:hypothetical protein n=1 Tax=Flavobacterium sp. TaxID=239 RepID=UPI00286C5007
MKKILLISSFFLVFMTNAQINKKNMEALYSKKINNAELVMYFKTNNSINYWSLYLKKTNGDSLKIDGFEKINESSSLPFKKHGDIKKQVIIGDAIQTGNYIYVSIYKQNKVFLIEYLIQQTESSKKEYFIANDFRGSYENFGDPTFSSEIKKINNELFIMSKYSGLTRFNLQSKEMKKLLFFNSPNISNSTSTLNQTDKNEFFNFNKKIIKTIYIDSNDQINFSEYQNNPKINIASDKILLIKGLKISNEKTYYFYEIKDVEKDNSYLKNASGVEVFNIFSKEDLNNLHDNDKVRLALISVLTSYYSKVNINFKLFDYIQEYGNEDISCFFYSDATSRIKIARYST